MIRDLKLLPLWSFVFIATTLEIAKGFYLRPIADDYCFAVEADHGLFTALLDRYSTAGGNLFESALVTLQVGSPLNLMPLQIASAVTSVTAVLALATLLWLIGRTLGAPERFKRNWLLSLCVIFLSWLPFWFLPAFFPIMEKMRPVYDLTARNMVFWQSVVSQYSFVPTVLFAGFLTLKVTSLQRLPKLVLSALIGLCFGTSSLMLALALVTLLILGLAFFRKAIRAWADSIWCLLVGVIVGIVLQISAPGTLMRLATVSGTSMDQGSEIGQLFSATFSGLSETPMWGLIWLGNVGVLFAFVTGVVFCNLKLNFLDVIRPNRLLKIATGSLVFGFLLIFWQKTLEHLTYIGHWHATYARVALYFAALFAGLWVGTFIRERKRFKAVQGISKLGFGLLGIVSILTGLYVLSESADRAKAWPNTTAYQGEAAEATAASWVMDCAVESGLIQNR